MSNIPTLCPNNHHLRLGNEDPRSRECGKEVPMKICIPSDPNEREKLKSCFGGWPETGVTFAVCELAEGCIVKEAW